MGLVSTEKTVTMEQAARVGARVAGVSALVTTLEEQLGLLVGEAREVYAPGLALLAGDLRMVLRDAQPKLDRAETAAADLIARVVLDEALARAEA